MRAISLRESHTGLPHPPAQAKVGETVAADPKRRPENGRTASPKQTVTRSRQGEHLQILAPPEELAIGLPCVQRRCRPVAALFPCHTPVEGGTEIGGGSAP